MTSSPIPTRPSRRLLGTALAAGLLLTAYGGGDSGSAGGGEGAQTGGTLTFAAGGTGGVYYPYGGGIANLLSSELGGTTVTVQETNASVDNMQLLASGQAQLAFGLGDVVSDAPNGENTFTEPLPLCSLGNIYNNFTNVFTTAATGSASIEDRGGKRVSPGAVGSAAGVAADRIMEAAGLDPQADIARAEVGLAEAVAALQDGPGEAGCGAGGRSSGGL